MLSLLARDLCSSAYELVNRIQGRYFLKTLSENSNFLSKCLRKIMGLVWTDMTKNEDL